AMTTAYNIIRLWDVETGKGRFTDPPGHDAPVHAVAFSPDGKLLVTGGENGRINIWNAISGRHQRQLLGQSAKVIKFSADGKYLPAEWIRDKTARVWDVATGEVKLNVTHGDANGLFGIALTPDTRRLVSLDRELARQNIAARLHVWDRSTGKRLQSVAFSDM